MTILVEVSVSHDENGYPVYMVRAGNGDWVVFTDYRLFISHLNALEATGHTLPTGYRHISHNKIMESTYPKTFDLEPDST